MISLASKPMISSVKGFGKGDATKSWAAKMPFDVSLYYFAETSDHVYVYGFIARLPFSHEDAESFRCLLRDEGFSTMSYDRLGVYTCECLITGRRWITRMDRKGELHTKELVK